MTERERRLEAAARNPEQIAEPPEESADRDKMRQMFTNSNLRPRWISDYEAGWKAAKAYFNVQD